MSDTAMSAGDVFADLDSREWVWGVARAKLSKGHYEALRLRFEDGLTFAAIAERLGLKRAEAARQRVLTALKRLRHNLSKRLLREARP